MAEQEQNDNGKQAGVRLDPVLFEVVEQMRIDEDRSMSNMIGVLLKTHPRIQPILESEPATAAVGN